MREREADDKGRDRESERDYKQLKSENFFRALTCVCTSNIQSIIWACNVDADVTQVSHNKLA